MKTLRNILFACFLTLTLSISQVNAGKQNESTKLDQNNFDLESFGAISLTNELSEPTIKMLTNKFSGTNNIFLLDSLSSNVLVAEEVKDKKRKELEAFLMNVRNQNRRFAGIIAAILLIFTVLVGFTSPLFRRDSRKSITENSPISLSRTMLFVWMYGILAASGNIWGATGNLPQWAVSVPLLLGVVIITFILSVFLEHLSYSSNFEANMQSENQFTLSSNNSFKPFQCIPKIQFLAISTVHLALLCAPAWMSYSFQELSIEVIIIQLISSMVYLGHKAYKIQKVHMFFFRKSIKNHQTLSI